MTLGVIALGRPTFDVEYAEDVAEQAFHVLDGVAPGFVGHRTVLFDAEATAAAIEAVAAAGVDGVLVLQVTFTDAAMTKALADAFDVPLVFWSFPEDRTGGRLRLNSLCGINLAAFVLGRAGRKFGYLYRRADDPAAPDELARVLAGERTAATHQHLSPSNDDLSDGANRSADGVTDALDGVTTGVIGQHPDGFDPCAYDAEQVLGLTGVRVERVELSDLFTSASRAEPGALEAVWERAGLALGSLVDLDQDALEKSLRLYCGMRELASEHGWSALATRCWPECFTEFGGAACAPQAMMTADGIPGGCEADVYGNLTSLILRELAGEAPFVADLVDLDVEDDSATFWHCGVAPIDMADPEVDVTATIHSNRRMPLLHEFPLKPGRVTIARLSQAGGSHKLVVGGGEMLKAPLPFSGTAGVVRFDKPAGEVLATVMEEGLEHHYGLVYGEYEEELLALAARWDIPVVVLT